MAEIIIMPKLGFNMNEGKLVQWYKKEGESVQKGENLFSVETDKTNMDIEAIGDGVVRRLLIEEGEQIPVTLPIAVVGTPEENIEALLAEVYAQLGKSITSELEPAQPPAATDGKGHMKITPRARRGASELGISLEGLVLAGTGFDGGICEKDIRAYGASAPAKPRKFATPVARNIAEAEGIDLEAVNGTGANGKITKNDVTAANAKAAPSVKGCAEVKCAADGREILEELPYTGVRKIIGARLAESASTAPHVYFTGRVDLERLLALRKEVNAVSGQKTSVTDYIGRAVVLSLQKFPEMNAALLGDTIVRYRTINLGIAVAAPGGLIVPAVKHAEKMKVTELSAASAALVEKARSGRLTPDEYSGGTFTVSNLGMFGIDNFTAIINPPEVGILAVSANKDEAVVVQKEDGTKEIAIRPMMNIQLSADHRVIDGLLAAQFVGEIKGLLENPLSLMI